MTDEPFNRGRIDLRAIDDSDGAHADRVVAAVMTRIRHAPAQTPRDLLLEFTQRVTRPALAAAAVLVAAAAGTVVVTGVDRASSAPPVATLASWADARHVPTNGELLLAFQGYRR